MTNADQQIPGAPDDQHYARVLLYAIREILGTAAAIAAQGRSATANQTTAGVLEDVRQSISAFMKSDPALRRLAQAAENDRASSGSP